MAIKDILKKLGDNASSIPKGVRRTPAEVELASFEERERQDQIKKKLGIFRQQASAELLMGNMLSDKGPSLINSKSTLLTKGNNLLKQKKTKIKNILNSKSTLFQ